LQKPKKGEQLARQVRHRACLCCDIVGMTRGKFIHLLPLALALTCFQSHAATISDSDCLDCHGIETLSKTNAAGLEISLFVDQAKFAASVHATNSCVSCHADTTWAHPDDN